MQSYYYVLTWQWNFCPNVLHGCPNVLHGCPIVLHDCPNVLHGSAIVTRLLSLTLAFVSKHSGNVTSAMENCRYRDKYFSSPTVVYLQIGRLRKREKKTMRNGAFAVAALFCYVEIAMGMAELCESSQHICAPWDWRTCVWWAFFVRRFCPVLRSRNL